VPLVAVPLAAVVTLLVAWAMIQLVKAWSSPLVGKPTGVISSVLSFLAKISFATYAVSAAAKVIQRDIVNRLGAAALPIERQVAGLFTGVAALVDHTGMALGNLATATEHAFNSLRNATIPRLLHAAVVPLARSLASLWRYAAHTLPAEIAHVGSLARSIAITVPRDIAIGERVVADWVGYTRRSLAKHLRMIAGALAAGVLAGTIAKVVARELAWGRCANVGRVGRALCGTPHRFLNDLLALLSDFFILTNICRVIPWLEEAFTVVAAPLIAQLARAGAGLCNAGYAREPDMIVSLPTLPPVDGTLYIP
jgi:hypothetical protein